MGGGCRESGERVSLEVLGCDFSVVSLPDKVTTRYAHNNEHLKNAKEVTTLTHFVYEQVLLLTNMYVIVKYNLYFLVSIYIMIEYYKITILIILLAVPVMAWISLTRYYHTGNLDIVLFLELIFQILIFKFTNNQ